MSSGWRVAGGGWRVVACARAWHDVAATHQPKHEVVPVAVEHVGLEALPNPPLAAADVRWILPLDLDALLEQREALDHAVVARRPHSLTRLAVVKDRRRRRQVAVALPEVLDSVKGAKVPLQVSGGANWKGLIPGRENDHTMFFATYGKISDEYGKYVTMGDVDAEMVYELGHRIQIIPSFYIQPSIQYVVDPGGGTNGDIDNALVLGAWIGAAF